MADRLTLTIAVLADRGGDIASTVASLHESAGRIGATITVELAATTRADPPRAVHVDQMRAFFPLGRGYLKNRALDDADTALVGFVEAGGILPGDWVATVQDAFAADPTLALLYGPEDEATRAGSRLDPLPALGLSTVTNLAVRRESVVRLGGFRLTLADASSRDEDVELAFRIVRNGLEARGDSRLTYARGRRDPRARVNGARELGSLTRRHRSSAPALAFASSLRRVRVPEAVRMTRAFVAGLTAPDRNMSPAAPLRNMPEAVRSRLGERRISQLPASRPPKTHLMYAAGSDWVLHLYVNPSDRLRRSLRERETIRGRIAITGIPALHAAVESDDALWVVEDAVHGARPDRAAPSTWFGQVAEWAVRFAGEPGPPLASSHAWREHRDAMLEVCPPGVRPELQRAVEAVERLGAVHMHGDFQRKNLLLKRDSVAVVDWEGAWLHGIPGLDLVFLALLARSDLPDAAVLEALAAGREPPFGRLSAYLARVGVDREVLWPALVVMLATWTLGEERRLARTRTPAAPRPYRDLLLSFARVSER